MSLPQKMFPGALPMTALLLAVSLAACSFQPYRIDIQQGNVVSAEQFAQLRVGMTREQVRFVLGTPLLTDVFHDRRWDYPYRMVRGQTREVSARNLSLFFDAEGKVEKIVADDAFRAQQPEEGNGNKVYDLSVPPQS